MMQPMQGAGRQTERDRRGMTQAQFEQSHVTDRCILAIHDYGTRSGVTRVKLMRQLKADGFTAFDISEAARRMGVAPKEAD
jgi:hypothetical protein